MAITVRIGMACLVGGLLACNLRLLNQLMPHGAFVLYARLAGLVMGVATGLVISRRLAHTDRTCTAWGGLIAAAATQPCFWASSSNLVETSLWMNSSLTSVNFLLAARVLLLMAEVPFPFGLALAWIANSSKDDPKPGLLKWGMPLGIGISIGTFVLGGIAGLIPRHDDLLWTIDRRSWICAVPIIGMADLGSNSRWYVEPRRCGTVDTSLARMR